MLLSSTVRELPGKSPKTSGEVRGTSGEVRGLLRSSGEPDSLPATHQICLQVGIKKAPLCQQDTKEYLNQSFRSQKKGDKGGVEEGGKKGKEAVRGGTRSGEEGGGGKGEERVN